MEKIKSALGNRIVQLAITLIVGIVIGAVFYPTKTIKETINQQYEQKINQMKDQFSKQQQDYQKQIDSLSRENTDIKKESSEKVASLTQEIKNLKTKKKVVVVKIVRPDGTIEERTEEESETDESSTIVADVKREYDQKIQQVEQKYKEEKTQEINKIAQEYTVKENAYIETINTLKKKTEIEINPKKYGIEVGYLFKDLFYLHSDATIFGPVFVGVQTQSNFTNTFSAGLGLGVRF